MGSLHRSPTHPIPSTWVFNQKARAPTPTKTRTFSHQITDSFSTDFSFQNLTQSLVAMLFQFIQYPHESVLPLISTPSSPVYSNSIMVIFRSNNMNILFWNSRGTRSRRIEFLNHLQANSIQLTLINESRLQPSAKLNFLMYFGYSSDRKDRLGGRKAFLIRKEIKHIKILPTLQHTGIQLRMNKELAMLSFTDNSPLMRQIPTC